MQAEQESTVCLVSNLLPPKKKKIYIYIYVGIMRPQYIAQSNARENTEPHLRTSMATRRAWARSALFAMWQNFALDPLELVPTPNIFFLTLTCQSPIVPTFSRVLSHGATMLLILQGHAGKCWEVRPL